MASNAQPNPGDRELEPKSLQHQEVDVGPSAAQTQERPEQSTPKPTTSQPANNANSSSSRPSQAVPTPDGTSEAEHPHTRDLYVAHIRIQTLEQQIFVAERHIYQFHATAGQREQGFAEHIQGLYHANTALDGNVKYLINELEKANAINKGLHRELQHEKTRALPAPAPLPAHQQPKSILKKGAITQHQVPPTSNNAQNQPVPIAPRPTLNLQTQNLPPAPASPLDDTTMLAYTQTNLRTLRAEIRALKASQKTLQDRLARLADAPLPDDVAADFLKGFGLPQHVLDKWFEVLKARDRKIAGLEASVETEREATAQMAKERCEKCGPVVVIDGEDGAEGATRADVS